MVPSKTAKYLILPKHAFYIIKHYNMCWLLSLSLSFVAHVWHLLWEALSFVLLIAVIFLCSFPFFLAWLSYFCCELNKTSKWILNWEERLQRCLNATSQAHPHILPFKTVWATSATDRNKIGTHVPCVCCVSDWFYCHQDVLNSYFT